jgi:hypothetical protein
MNESLKETLRVYGLQLMDGHYPEVFEGGDIRFTETANWEKHHGQQQQTGSTRSTTGTRERSEAWQGSPGQATSLISESDHLKEYYTGQLSDVLEAYPKTEYWELNEGMIMKIQSKILSGLSRTAVFLVRIPFNDKQPVLAWGFWKEGGYSSIGPRHTNFPDASICAFEPKDGTWKHGDELVELIDLYSLWALRHLHLEVFGRWPGHQIMHHPYERLLEINDDEICSCPQPKGIYQECCKNNDQSFNRLALAIQFTSRLSQNGVRQPPAEILPFVSQLTLFNAYTAEQLWISSSPGSH